MRPSNDSMPSASHTPSCGKDPYLSSLRNCVEVAGVVGDHVSTEYSVKNRVK
jgi:hypothetical protein